MTSSSPADQEIAAIQAILDALTPLDGQALRRVLDYVQKRLSISNVLDASPQIRQEPFISAESGMTTATDIKSLRMEKQPKSSNQMASLVAYYLAELAPLSERRPDVSTADIEKYFKQAAFPLPRKPAMTLANATAAGYLDAVGGGKYRLNPVGFNLVVHHLPANGGTGPSASRRATKKPRGKAVRKRR